LHGDHKPTHVDSDTNIIAYVASRRRRGDLSFWEVERGRVLGGFSVGGKGGLVFFFGQGEPDS